APGFFIGRPAREPAAQPIANETHDSAEANEGRSAEFQEELAALTERLRASKADIERLTELLESSESTRFETDSPLHGAGGLDAAVAVNPKIRPAKFIPRGDIPENERIRFNRDVRPILSGTCFACHGPDRKTRQAGLRLDDGIVAFTELKSGKTPIIPFDLSKSELIRRITTNDKADRMPPASFEQSLSEGQVDLLKRWVEQGAEWERHWAYIPPTQPELPPVKVEDWGKNPIDSFVLARLESEGLTPRDEASREALIRRVTLDLIGLPPTLEEVDAFTADDGPGAYERLVDNLLARPQYGEHMARYWLDASRYADTNGYHIDNERTMWPWRDWVITAFNENKPFDEFATEQLAGDLLPDPTLDQKIATGFNRNHMINFEGGAIPEEYRVNYVIDRVNTVGTVFLGMTVGCAQCHDHKYDPLSQREFYQLFSFFDKISEEGLDGRNGNSVPTVLAADPEAERRLADFADRIAKLESKRNDPMLLVDAAQSMWAEKWSEKIAERWVQLEPERAITHGEAFLVQLSDGTTLAVGDNPDKETYEVTAEIKQENITTIRLDALVHETLDGATGRADNGSFALDEFEAWISPLDGSADPMPIKFIAAHADYAQRGFAVENAIDADLETSWAVDGNESKEDRTALFVAERPFGFQGGSRLRIKMQFGNRRARHAIGRFRLSISTDPKLAPVEMSEWYQNGPFPAETGEEAHDTAYEPEAQPIDVEAKYADGKPKWIELPDFEDGKTQHILGDVAATYFYRTIDSPGAREMVIRTGSNDALMIWLNGEVVFDHNERRGLKKGEDRIELRLVEGENRLLAKVVNYGGSEYAFNFRKVSEELAEIPLEVERILSVDAGDRAEEQIVQLREQFRSYFPRWRELDKELDSLRKSQASFKEDIPSPL
ncbi:DUF1549 domain-containing protein, partial [Candidatus Sumerlaeota bacterium]|nr:DUF1549 domain-containing protein [Candidatus Sumerlaeota bacterium]